jgi:hypothetical protein
VIRDLAEVESFLANGIVEAEGGTAREKRIGKKPVVEKEGQLSQSSLLYVHV